MFYVYKCRTCSALFLLKNGNKSEIGNGLVATKFSWICYWIRSYLYGLLISMYIRNFGSYGISVICIFSISFLCHSKEHRERIFRCCFFLNAIRSNWERGKKNEKEKMLLIITSKSVCKLASLKLCSIGSFKFGQQAQKSYHTLSECNGLVCSDVIQCGQREHKIKLKYASWQTYCAFNFKNWNE